MYAAARALYLRVSIVAVLATTAAFAAGWKWGRPPLP
jgi:hypothetical protein